MGLDVATDGIATIGGSECAAAAGAVGLIEGGGKIGFGPGLLAGAPTAGGGATSPAGGGMDGGAIAGGGMAPAAAPAMELAPGGGIMELGIGVMILGIARPAITLPIGAIEPAAVAAGGGGTSAAGGGMNGGGAGSEAAAEADGGGGGQTMLVCAALATAGAGIWAAGGGAICEEAGIGETAGLAA